MVIVCCGVGAHWKPPKQTARDNPAEDTNKLGNFTHCKSQPLMHLTNQLPQRLVATS